MWASRRYNSAMRPILYILCLVTAGFASARDFQRADFYTYAAGQNSHQEIAGGGATAISPLPVNFLAGMAILDLGGRFETDDQVVVGHTQFGLTYLQHVAEGVPNFRLTGRRFGSAGTGRPLRPVVESEVVLQGNDVDSSWLRLLPGFRTRVGIGARSSKHSDRGPRKRASDGAHGIGPKDL